MSRRLLAAAGSAALAAGLLAGPLAATGSASTSIAGWAQTGTRALHLKATDLGAAPSTQRLDISVTLPLRNRSEINKLIVSMGTPGSPNYEHYLTPAQVAAKFGPTPSAVSAVERYLTSQGFTNISAASNRLLVSGHATVAQAERAFHTQISDYRLDGHVVYENTSAALVPSPLHADVAAVLGLSDMPMHMPLVVSHPAHPSSTTAGTPYTGGFTERALQHAYDAASMPAATSTSIAIISSGDETPIINNLRYAEKVQKFPKVPVSVVYDGPKSGIIYGNPLTGNLEWDLDTQMSTMMAQSVKHLYIYDVLTYTDPEVARGINMFVAQDKAQALSASLGECDYIAWFDGAMLTSDESLAEGALQGQSAFASTGDNGYACPEVASTGVPEGPPGVSWPADGEYTTAVGGTTLYATQSGQVVAPYETAWVGGGGGVSPYETAAPWTFPANGAGQTWQYTNQGGRSVPDVSADADNLISPVLIYSGGKTPTGVGGTSVSSPLTMGLWARMETVRHNSLGLAQYDFYCYYDKVNPATIEQTALGPVYIPDTSPGPVPGFRDIIVGTDGVWFAKPGYDYTSGIGSVQAALLATKLKRNGA